MEIWKDIKGYEGVYKCSNYGRIKRLKGWHNYERILKSVAGSENGYVIQPLSHNCKRKTHAVHRIIAIAFIPNPYNKRCINHKDGNKLNNYVTNLEWCTYKENMIHSFKKGTHDPHRPNSYKRLNKFKVRVIKKSNDLTIRELSNIFNVEYSTIWKIINKKTYV